MFAKFGSKVTVSYRGERLLRNMENELGEAALKGLQGLGAEVIFHSTVQSAKAGTAVVKTAGGTRNVGYDSLLVAAGRSPDFDGLGLEKTGVKIADGLISVDGAMRTADGNIYAVGDVVAGPQLAHKAFRQGKVAAEHIAGKKSAYDNMAMPMVVFTEPELASVGLGEAEARKQGHDVVTGRMPLSASGRAKAAGKPEGFVKIVADRQGTVLGVHVAGYDAGALIAEAALAIEMGAQLEDIAATIHAHPTMPESLMESAEDALGKSIHLFHGKRQ
jgi:dihydrolipoamide dehydrogenase